MVRDDYRLFARTYEVLGHGYGLGRMAELEREQASRIREGDRVLYAGAGTAGAARFALERGARVTLVDRSRAMLGGARRRLARYSRVQYRLADLRSFESGPAFDHVCANFLLNVYAAREASGMIECLGRLIRPEGELHVGDFAPDGGPLQRIYFGVPLVVFWALARNAWHGLDDYGALAEAHSLRVIRQRDFRFGPGARLGFRLWTFSGAAPVEPFDAPDSG